MILDWAAAGRAFPGEVESGDRPVVAIADDGALVGLIDGLGHGLEASHAARIATLVIEENAGAPLAEVVERCHDALARTRGAAMSLASIDARADTITWIGIGNVEGVLYRRGGSYRDEAIVARGGIVGLRLPPLRFRTLPISIGDLIVFSTDGVKGGFRAPADPDRAAQEIADAILADFAKPTDDACVLVARYLGRADAVVAIHAETDVAAARARVRTAAANAGLGDTAIEALVTAASEIARNVLVHAGAGELVIRVEASRVLVIARDDGPGIADVDQALADGFTTGDGLGLGLAGARRLVDDFSIVSAPGRGTTVTLEKKR
jgi:anti-sigma regulatory factor (Ser/Thr protein kinase)